MITGRHLSYLSRCCLWLMRRVLGLAISLFSIGLDPLPHGRGCAAKVARHSRTQCRCRHKTSREPSMAAPEWICRVFFLAVFFDCGSHEHPAQRVTSPSTSHGVASPVSCWATSLLVVPDGRSTIGRPPLCQTQRNGGAAGLGDRDAATFGQEAVGRVGAPMPVSVPCWTNGPPGGCAANGHRAPLIWSTAS